LRVVVAAVLAVAADAVLVAQNLLTIDAHLVASLTRLHVRNPARRSSLEVGRSGETQEASCVSLARETGNARGTRACIPNGKVK
jgi:hypothetical protein